MALTATYDATLSRVVLAATGINATSVRTEIRRWENGEVTSDARADLVRGGDLGAVTTGTAYDYEFAPGVANVYQLRSYNVSGTLLDTMLATQVTPVLTATWLKSIYRPFLNRTVVVTAWSEVASAARGGVLQVMSRREPVAVTDLRGARTWSLELMAADDEEADAIELALSFGDVLLFQGPAGCPVPDGYVWVGDTTRARRATYGTRRYLTLPLTEVAAPDPSVVGYTVTWAGIVAAYATWTTLGAAKATWLAVNQTVSTPTDEVVG